MCQRFGFNITEKETSELVDELSKDGVLHMMFDIDKVNDLHKVLQELYKSNVELNKSIQIVAVCRFYNTRKLLKMVSISPFYYTHINECCVKLSCLHG